MIMGIAKLKEQMAECPRCHVLLSMRYGTTLLTHLQNEHKIDLQKSVIILEDVFTAILVKMREQRKVLQEVS
jgi:hypothetical protein